MMPAWLMPHVRPGVAILQTTECPAVTPALHCVQVVGEMKDLVKRYDAAVEEERELSPEKRIVANVGKMDAKKHLASNVTALMGTNINQAMGMMMDTVVF